MQISPIMDANRSEEWVPRSWMTTLRFYEGGRAANGPTVTLVVKDSSSAAMGGRYEWSAKCDRAAASGAESSLERAKTAAFQFGDQMMAKLRAER